MNVNVFRAKADDPSILAQLADLLQSEETRPTVAHLQQLVADDRNYLFVAQLGDEVIGYALAYRFPSLYESSHLAYLYDIEVLESLRRIGVGRKLMHCLLDELRTDGVEEVWLGTATDNLPAQVLFAATGGVPSDETFKDYTFSLEQN